MLRSWSPTNLPMRPSTPDGGSSHRRRSAKDLVPEFSLQMNNILRLSVASISIKARMRIAIDFDLPAPKNPWIHRSWATPLSLRRVCPRHVRRAQRSKDSAVERVHVWSSPSTWHGISTRRSNWPHKCKKCDLLLHPFLQLPFGHYRCLIQGRVSGLHSFLTHLHRWLT